MDIKIDANLLQENNPKPLEQAMKSVMGTPIAHFEGELLKIRTGRAHPSIVEDIIVSCYGNMNMPIKQVATVATPDAKLITIQPWDKSLINDIEKAILASDVHITPVNNGDVIHLRLPEISTDRREEMVKLLHKKLEECRVAIRNIRKDFNNLVRDGKKDKLISENFFNRLTDVVQQITDLSIEKAEAIAEKKEKSIRTI